MPANTFNVHCGECGRIVTIRSVAEYHSAGRFKGYSYQVVCSCGSRIWVDGCDGEEIPDSMKQAAALNHRADQAKTRIDEERRAMPSSPTKAMLKQARIQPPQAIGRDCWLVYSLPNGRAVSFSMDEECYSLIDSGEAQSFEGIGSLMEHLSGSYDHSTADRPNAVCRFVTNTATFAVFDPTCLRHRATAVSDWWSMPDEEVAEINAGNVLFVGLSADGAYTCAIYWDDDDAKFPADALVASIRTEIGCFYFGAGEEVPAHGIGPDTRDGGVLMALPARSWKVAVSCTPDDHIIVRMAPSEIEARNSFSSSPLLTDL